MVGQHQGLPLYTVGQRRGFEVDQGLAGPFYVMAKKIKKNQLVVGFGKETEKKEFKVKKVNWISDRPSKLPLNCRVRIRHQGELIAARVQRLAARKTSSDGGRAKHLTPPRWYQVSLVEPQRGIAPGQSAVFYRRREVLGGGVIKT